MQNYDFVLSVAQPVALIQAAGVNVYYKTGTEASGKTGIRVRGEGGGLDIVLLPGEGITLPVEQSRFTLTEADPTAVSVAGTFLIGKGLFTASRVQGDMTVLNGAGLADADYLAQQARIIALTEDQTIARIPNTVGPVGTSPGGYGVRLRNPAASGRVLIVHRVEIVRQIAEPAAGTKWGFRWIEAAGAGLGTEAASLTFGDGSATVGLLSSAAANTTAGVGDPAGTHPEITTPPGAGFFRYVWAGPLFVLPGKAITCGVTSGNALEAASVTYEWTERPLV